MKRFLFVILYLLSWCIWGQEQTITYDTLVKVQEVKTGVFDTIYYVQKHIQINQELVVVDTVRGQKWAIDVYGGISLRSSKARYIESNLTFNSSKTAGYHIGGSMYYNFPKKWSLRIGAKLDYQKISADYTKQTDYTIDVFEEVNDTLDTYYTISGVDTNYFHIIEQKTIKSIEEKTEYSDLTYDWEIYFLKIPIQASYAFERNRWSCNFLAGASLNFLLQKIKSNSEQQQESKISFFPSAILSLQTGYFLGNSTFFYVEPIYENSFIKAQNSVFSTNQFSLSIGLKQFF